MSVSFTRSGSFIPISADVDIAAPIPGHSKIAILYRNEADFGTIDAVNQVSTLPGVFLQQPQLTKVWRTPDGVFSSAIKLDLGVARPLDCVAALACNLSAAGVTRIMLSNVNALSGELYDTTAIGAGVDSVYKSLVHVLPATVTARYVRVEFYDDSLAHIEAGRLIAGPLWKVAHNYDRSSIEKGTVDDSPRELAISGESWVESRPVRRWVRFALPRVNMEEIALHLDAMGRIAGRKRDVLAIVNPAAPNVPQETYWGLMTEAPNVRNSGFRAWRQSIEIVTQQ